MTKTMKQIFQCEYLGMDGNMKLEDVEATSLSSLKAHYRKLGVTNNISIYSHKDKKTFYYKPNVRSWGK